MRKYFAVSSMDTLMLFQRLRNCFAQLFEEKIGMPPLKRNQIRTVSNSTAANLQGLLCNSRFLDSCNVPFAALKLIPFRNLSEIKDDCSCISIILLTGYNCGLEVVTRLSLSLLHQTHIYVYIQPKYLCVCILCSTHIYKIYIIYIKFIKIYNIYRISDKNKYFFEMERLPHTFFSPLNSL